MPNKKNRTTFIPIEKLGREKKPSDIFSPEWPAIWNQKMWMALKNGYLDYKMLGCD
jgi:hypothetical protein